MTRRAQSILAALAAILAVVLMLTGCASRPVASRQSSAPAPHAAPTAQENAITAKAIAPPAPATARVGLSWPPVPFVPGYEIFYTPALTQPFTKIAETGGQTNILLTNLNWSQGYLVVKVMKRYGQS